MEGMTKLVVREMTLKEADIIIDYFHGASHDFLRSLGVSPAKLPYRDDWERVLPRRIYAADSQAEGDPRPLGTGPGARRLFNR